MNQPHIAGIAPFFIVHSVKAALAFYNEKLGFETIFQDPANDPFLQLYNVTAQ